LAPNSLNTGQNRSEFHMSIDEAVHVQLNLNLFSWASFFDLNFELDLLHLTGPELLLSSEHVLRQSGLIVLGTDSFVYFDSHLRHKHKTEYAARTFFVSLASSLQCRRLIGAS